MTKLTEERIKELATAQRGPRGELIWPDFPINFARAIEAVLQPVQEPVALDLIAANEACDKLNELCREQTAEIERLRNLSACEACAEIPSVMEYFKQCEERIATLEAALRAAKEMVESWGAYASPYFQERHDLVGDIAILSKALGEE